MASWNDDEVRMLIDERKANNKHYYSLGRSNCKRVWWQLTADKINQSLEWVSQDDRQAKNSKQL